MNNLYSDIKLILIKIRADINAFQKDDAIEHIHSLKNILTAPANDNTFFQIIAIVASQTEFLINTESFEQAYDLIDAIHCLPEILMTTDKDMYSYWNLYILKYQLKWNTNLFDELKETILQL